MRENNKKVKTNSLPKTGKSINQPDNSERKSLIFEHELVDYNFIFNLEPSLNNKSKPSTQLDSKPINNIKKHKLVNLQKQNIKSTLYNAATETTQKSYNSMNTPNKISTFRNFQMYFQNKQSQDLPQQHQQLIVSNQKNINSCSMGNKIHHNDVLLPINNNFTSISTIVKKEKEIEKFKGNIKYTINEKEKEKDKEEQRLKNKDVTKYANFDHPLLKLITAKCFTILDSINQTIIQSRKNKKKREMASLTKIMTCYAACILIGKLKLDLNQEIEVSGQAARTVGTSANLKSGDILTLNDILYGLMLPSGNDAAICIAEFLGRKLIQEQRKFEQLFEHEQQNQEQIYIASNNNNSFNKKQDNSIKIKEAVSAFISEMNSISANLGMTDTQYQNPHGLSNKFNVSTCNDLSCLVSNAMKNPLFKEIVKARQYKCNITQNGEKREQVWENTNKLLYRNECVGVKTGVTPAAGPCMAVAFNMNNSENLIIVILLKSNNINQRFTEALHLYQYVKKIKEEQ